MSTPKKRLSFGDNYNVTLAGSVTPRKFTQLTDVNMIGVKNGDLVAYDEATKTFVPISSPSIDFPDELNTIYVSKNGNDENGGKTIQEAKLTLESAVGIASAGTVIKVSAGNYIINNPITLPDQVSIVGASLREVSISCANFGDLFYVGAGNYVAEMSFTGTKNSGAIFSFDPINRRYINQSPYIQNCTNFIPDSIGLRVDGNKAIGPIKSMVLDSYTQYNQGGIGVSITNEGYAQLVSLFTICNNIAVYCGSGGACDLTNSNSSFGNYGLVADGLSPLKYSGITTETSVLNSDTFTINFYNPDFNISNAVYDNVSGILTAYTTDPHNFYVGMGISLSGLGFTCSYEPGIRYYPSGEKGYIFEVNSIGPGRYVDASNSITANRTEIVDKSLAAIALNHPDFVFPGDSANDVSYRYKDSYRLIQQNKQEIVDKSLASIAIGFPTGFHFPTDPVPYNQNRYYDASRLIQINKQEIIDKSLAAVAVGFSTFYFPGDTQTNARSRYYDAYRLIQKNRTEIINTAWANAASVYPLITSTEVKCKRDLGFFVDAVSADVFTGGNNYAKQFALQYFDNVGNPISNGLVGEIVESNYAFNQARNLMKSAITNQLTYKELGISVGLSTYGGSGSTIPNTNINACADVQSNINTLVSIITTTVGAGNTSSLPSTNFGSFTTGGTKCARDIGYLVDALSTDVFTGGNAYARGFTLQYFDNSGNPISNGLVGEQSQSITAFAAVRDYAKKAVTNQLNVKNFSISSGPSIYGSGGSLIPVNPSGNVNSCADVQSNINNLVGIVTTVIGAGTTTSLPTLNLGISTTNKCARDIGYFVDAVSTDLFTGGNSYVIGFTEQYFNSVGSATTALLGEESQSIYAFNSVRDYAKKAIVNQLNIKDHTITADSLTGSNTSSASCANVQSTINTLVGITTQTIAAGNLNLINSISLNGGTFLTGESKCRRDVGYIVDAVASDVKNFTNKSIVKATKSYFTSSGLPISNGLVGVKTESITAFNAARDYSKLAINNMLNVKNLTLLNDPLTNSNTDPASCSNVQHTIDTLTEILTTSIGRGDLVLLPPISTFSNEFTINVGTSTLPHTYNSRGTARLNIVRPFDGQVIYFNNLYSTVNTIKIINGGSGYTRTPYVTIDPPTTSWGIPAQAIAIVKNGSVVGLELVSSGRGYTAKPSIRISAPNVGLNNAVASIEVSPTYHSIQSSILISPNTYSITLNDNIPYIVEAGAEVYFYKQSRVLASGHSLEYIGSGTEITSALPTSGGVPIQDNETDARNGGLVVYTSTDQSGNFRIGDGVVINQQTGNVSGRSYSKSLFAQMTPFILALGGD
jgi:hypothetical protein